MRQLDRHGSEFFTQGLGFSQLGSSHFFEFRAAGFEFGNGALRGAAGTTGRDQEVACVAVLDLDHIAQGAEIDNFVEQDDLHVRLSFRRGAGRCKAAWPGSVRA
ncbi:hypothetical protein D9M68_945690 [compost metagenome]